ncbi:MAG: type II secretion system F family protein [Acidimicrobiia bacterium]|nr:type II secretion system F family protein [Acidimicrobiia bacterium]
MSVLVASIITVLSIPLLVYALWPERRSATGHRFDVLHGVSNIHLGASIRDRILAPLLDATARQARRITPGGVIESSRQQLLFAGLGNQLPVEALLSVKTLTTCLGLVCGLVLSIGAGSSFRIFMILLFGAVGFLGPDVYVRRRADRRQRAIVSALPDTLDQLTVLLEAGLGFNTAVEKIARSTTGPLVDEFARALHSIRLGQARNEALEDIATRTGTPEVRQFVSAIKQADSLGVPMARVARVQSEHMREIKRLHSEEQAMRLPVKLVFPMVFCMLPTLFIVLLGPVVIRVMNSGL